MDDKAKTATTAVKATAKAAAKAAKVAPVKVVAPPVPVVVVPAAQGTDKYAATTGYVAGRIGAYSKSASGANVDVVATPGVAVVGNRPEDKFANAVPSAKSSIAANTDKLPAYAYAGAAYLPPIVRPSARLTGL